MGSVRKKILRTGLEWHLRRLRLPAKAAGRKALKMMFYISDCVQKGLIKLHEKL